MIASPADELVEGNSRRKSGRFVLTSDGRNVLVTFHAQRRFRERTGLDGEALDSVITCGAPTLKKPWWVRPHSATSKLKAIAWLRGTVWSTKGRIRTEHKVVVILGRQSEVLVAMTVVAKRTGRKRFQ